MGNRMSEEQRRQRDQEELECFERNLSDGADLKVCQSIVRFCSLDSSENLKQHYEQKKREMQMSDFAADWTKNLVEKLAGLTSAPELAGLGALAIAVLIDIISSSPPEDNTQEALRSVFAEEKVSEVWDLIELCLTRCSINMDNRQQLRKDLELIEFKLNKALIKLKNSMVRNGQMSSEALRAWVNGAALHIQTLLHLVRLRGTHTCQQVTGFLQVYQKDLDTLFEKHKKMIEGKCNLNVETNGIAWEDSRYSSLYGTMHIHESPYESMILMFLVDEESHSYLLHEEISYSRYLEVYYDRRYMRQKREVKRYFSEVGRNLESLVSQTGFFSIQ